MGKRGYYGIGIYGAKKEHNLGTLFRSAYSFGASFIFTVGARYKHQSSDTVKAYKHIPLYQYQDIDALVNNIPHGCPIIGVELAPQAHKLNNFVHPEQAMYLLGAEDYGIPQTVLDRLHHIVEIPGASRCLNVSTAGAIIMYDRIIKREL
jgi:tRNA G18 (ribose-2'-O)-methylase SpoU